MMNIKEKFLELTSRTYPHGTETELFKLLPDSLNKDEFGNLFIKVGDSNTMFTSHLDTATSALTTVTHIINDNIIKSDGKTILGADDKAGVTIMLYMIENNVPGLYYFFLGEEVGCVGSKKLSNKLKTKKIEGINKVVSFDRRGYDSVITFQSGQRCASEKFSEALASQLNTINNTFSYKTDPTGVLTDSIQFISIYPECTNISVGYKSEHTFNETQDINHLEKLAKACVNVKWDELPIERDPSKTEYRSYGYGRYVGYDDWEDDYWNDPYYTGRKYNTNNTASSYDTSKYNYSVKTEKVYFYDSEFEFVSTVEINMSNHKILKVDLHKDRIQKEKIEIYNLFKLIEVDFDAISWDGLNLRVERERMKDFTIDRNDLLEYLPSLDYTKFDNT
jgi:putative aminopeptidase FrvX